MSISSGKEQGLYHAINNPTFRNEIRLLTIEHAAHHEAELKCSLFQASLDGELEYFALSYLWGDPTVTAPILVNNVPVSVTRNLEAALRYIRQRDKPTTFWVDALCINQTDNKEKESQLPLMGSIYANARTVYVFTGHPDEHSRNTFELIRRWTTSLDPSFDSMRYDARDLQPKCKQWFQEQDWTNHEHLIDEKLFESANCYFDRPYWRRVWVQQEMLLGQVTTIMAGNDCISFPRMFAFFEAEHRTARQHVLRYFRSMLNRPPVVSAGIALHHSDMAWVIESLRMCQASKEHDKVYGFLGLLLRDDTTFVMGEISYEQSAANVYVQFVLAMAYSDKHGRLFVDGSNGIGYIPRLERLCQLKDKIPDLPSWAPDFTVGDRNPIIKEQDAPEPYGAAKNTRPIIRISKDRKVLTSRGVVFDRVESLSFVVGNLISNDRSEAEAAKEALINYLLPKLEEEHPTGISSLQACFRSVFPIRPEADPNLIYRAFGFLAVLAWYDYKASPGQKWSWSSFTAKFASNLSQGQKQTFQSHDPQREEKPLPLKELLRQLADGQHEVAMAFFVDNNYLQAPQTPIITSLKDHGKNVRQFWEAATQWLKHRTMFTTEKHYIGKGPQGLMKGDYVCVLYGCDRPLAIRRMINSDMYEVVGPILMYGVQNGEIIKQAKAGKLYCQELSFR